MSKNSNRTTFLLQPRCLNQGEDGLRAFQRQAIDCLHSESHQILVIHAPVGAGKSHIVCELLKRLRRRKERSQVFLTFPTLALMNAQVDSLLQNKDLIQWINPLLQGSAADYGGGKVGLFSYSSAVLYEMLSKEEAPERLDKGKFITRALDEMFFRSRQGVVVTTPDVLYLMMENVYNRTLKAKVKGALIFFDEFHLYHNLAHFKDLLETLIDFGARLIFMSATPYFSDDAGAFLKRHEEKIVQIACEEEDPSDQSIPFNYPIDAHVWNIRYTKQDELYSTLIHLLPESQKPAAVIFDSVFRLLQITPKIEAHLRKQDPQIRFIHYHGISKDSVQLTEKTILWGTSSIEVGVDFKNLKTLVTEVSYWPNAIQRLGRVGRHGSGTAHLLTSRRFTPFRHEYGEVCSRTVFEEKGLKRILNNPKQTMIYGNMFRGDSHSFVLHDVSAREDNRKIIYYDEKIFSMFDIDDYCADWRKRTGWKEKMEALEEYRFPKEKRREILLKDLVFPFRGLLVGRMRPWYRSIEIKDQGKDGLLIIPDGDPSIRFE